MEIPRWIPIKELKVVAEQYGGLDERDFERIETNLPYYDKFHHAQRSLANQPNHANRKDTRTAQGARNGSR